MKQASIQRALRCTMAIDTSSGQNSSIYCLEARSTSLQPGIRIQLNWRAQPTQEFSLSDLSRFYHLNNCMRQGSRRLDPSSIPILQRISINVVPDLLKAVVQDTLLHLLLCTDPIISCPWIRDWACVSPCASCFKWAYLAFASRGR